MKKFIALIAIIAIVAAAVFAADSRSGSTVVQLTVSPETNCRWTSVNYSTANAQADTSAMENATALTNPYTVAGGQSYTFYAAVRTNVKAATVITISSTPLKGATTNEYVALTVGETTVDTTKATTQCKVYTEASEGATGLRAYTAAVPVVVGSTANSSADTYTATLTMTVTGV